jgi:hypothetical protein
MSFWPPTLHNKIGWPKKRIGHSKRWQEPCLMSIRLLTGFGRKRSIRRVMPQTIPIFTCFSRRHLMSSLPITSQMSLTLESLEASAIFFKSRQNLLNLLLKFMKDSCLAMIQTHTHIVFSTRTPVVLKPHVTQYLMRLMAFKLSNMISIL